GRAYRAADLGGTPEAGRREAVEWIRGFARSREGRGYRPWAERFVAGRLPLAFGDGSDPRERWWRLVHMQRRLGVLELRARADASAAAAARTLRAFVERLSLEIGRAPENDPATARLNDLDRDGLAALLERADVEAAARGAISRELLARWPYRS